MEDDPAVRRVLRRWLEKTGCGILEADSGSAGLKLCLEERPDLILMDWMLGSGPQGVEICEQLKADPRSRAVPIVIMTGAKVNFQDELSALSAGADLYLTKDQILGEGKEKEVLTGYISALLRRPYKVRAHPRKEYLKQGLYLDLAEHVVKTPDGGVVRNLSTLQFSVLYLLAKKYPSTVSRRYLVHSIWKSPVRDREVDVMVSRLKSKIEKGRTLIESIFGRGYRLCAPATLSGLKASEEAPATSVAGPEALPDS